VAILFILIQREGDGELPAPIEGALLTAPPMGVREQLCLALNSLQEEIIALFSHIFEDHISGAPYDDSHFEFFSRWRPYIKTWSSLGCLRVQDL
jgi:hypothetical protein